MRHSCEASSDSATQIMGLKYLGRSPYVSYNLSSVKWGLYRGLYRRVITGVLRGILGD